MITTISRSLFLAAVAAIGLGTAPVWADDAGPAPAAPHTTAPAARVLVIPFSALNVPDDQKWIAKGVEENFIADLGRGGGLSPIAFDGQIIVEDNSTAVRLARQASADLAVRGAAQVVGDTVRLTAQLIDAKTGYTITTASATGGVRDILHLEDQLTAELRGLPPATAGAPSTAPSYAPADQSVQAPQVIVVPQAPSYPSAYTPGYAPSDYGQYYSPYDYGYSSYYPGYYPSYSYPYYPFYFSGGIFFSDGHDHGHDHGHDGGSHNGGGGHDGGHNGGNGGGNGHGGWTQVNGGGTSGGHGLQSIRPNPVSMPNLTNSARLPIPTNAPGVTRFSQPISSHNFSSGASHGSFGGSSFGGMPMGGASGLSHASFGGGGSFGGGHASMGGGGFGGGGVGGGGGHGGGGRH